MTLFGRFGSRGRERPVSVVVNTLDRSAYLGKTLDSFASQNYSNFEVIVVNGPSQDGTAAMLRSRRDRLVVLDCPEANLGRSRNVGVEAAAGEIVVFIDDDAVPEPDWLARLVAQYDDGRVGAVGGPVYDIPLGRVDWKICTCTRLGVPNTDSPAPISQYSTPGADPLPYLAGCNMSFRRDVLVQVDGFHPLLRYGYDDVEVCARVVDRGWEIRYASDAFVHHERAPSAVRNAERQITDPHPVVFSRTVFALQCERSPHGQEEIESAIGGWVEEWIRDSEGRRVSGERSNEDHRYFTHRARAGFADGLAAGRSERPQAIVGQHRRHPVHRYRCGGL